MIEKTGPTFKKILFMCIENSCRSQIAEAFARIHGAGCINAYSAGSHPSGIVNPNAIVVMGEKACSLSKHNSKSLEDIPVLEYDYVITMGCGDNCPFVRAKKREDWNIPDPKEMTLKGLRTVRDLIETRVKELLQKIDL